MGWFKGLSIAWKFIVTGLIIISLVLAFNFVDDAFSKKAETEAELSQNQGDAAIESGQDAVNTVGEQGSRESDRTETLKEIQNEVDESETEHDAHTSGSDGLCEHFYICP